MVREVERKLGYGCVLQVKAAVYLHYYKSLKRAEVGCIEICVSLGTSHPETKALCNKGGQKVGTKVIWAEVQFWGPGHSREIRGRRRK